MCIIIKENFKVATEDIRCYKFVLKREKFYEGFFSGYRYPVDSDTLVGYEQTPGEWDEKIFEKNIEFGNKVFKSLTNANVYDSSYENTDGYYLYDENVTILTVGGIHSYTSIEEMLKHNIYCWDYDVNKEHIEIYECIIPKGTRYFEGYSLGCGDGNTIECDKFLTYASEKLVFLKNITDEFSDKLKFRDIREFTDEQLDNMGEQGKEYRNKIQSENVDTCEYDAECLDVKNVFEDESN